MTSPIHLTFPFITPVPQLVRQSKSPEDREIGRRFALLFKVLAPKLHEIFPESDDEGNLVVPALDVWAQVLSVYGRRNGVGKPVFGLAPLGHEQKFSIIALDLYELHISDDVLRQLVNEASNPAPSPPRLSAAWRVEASFFSAAFLFGGSCMLHFVFADANRDLYSANRQLAWNTSIHIDTSRALQRASSGLPQDIAFQPHDLLARVTYVPRMTIDSTTKKRFSLGAHCCMKVQAVIVSGVLLVVLHINVADAMS